MKKYPVIAAINSENRVMFGALLALSLMCLSILAGGNKAGGAISVGIFCFAVAIPALAFCSERVRIDQQYSYRTHSDWIDLAEFAGILGALLGVGCIFWHFSWIAAVVFGVACYGANALLLWYQQAMQELNDDASALAD